MAIPSDAELGPKMEACSPREREFVWALVCNGGDGTAAARSAGYSDASGACWVRAHELRSKQRVIEAIHECSWKLLGSIGLKAVHSLEVLVSNPDHPDHFKAVTAVLSRIGFGEKALVQHHHTGSIDVNHTDAALEALTYMRSLNVPRETLEQQFGKSGLSRYERMLEERDSKRMKVIEGKVDDKP